MEKPRIRTATMAPRGERFTNANIAGTPLSRRKGILYYSIVQLLVFDARIPARRESGRRATRLSADPIESDQFANLYSFSSKSARPSSSFRKISGLGKLCGP